VSFDLCTVSELLPAQTVDAAGEGVPATNAMNLDTNHLENTAMRSAAATPVATPPNLFYGSQSDEEDLERVVYAHPDLALNLTSRNDDDSLLGHWGGHYTLDANLANGLVSFYITSHDVLSGSFEGNGTDMDGDFSLSGRIDSGKNIFFVTQWSLHPDLKWSHYGRFDGEELAIQGVCGSPKPGEGTAPLNIASSDASTETDTLATDIECAGPTMGPSRDSAEVNRPQSPIASDARNLQVIQGTFLFQRRPLCYFLFRPPKVPFLASRPPRALWHWAQDSVLAHVRMERKTLHWEVLRKRRDRRYKFIALYNAEVTQSRGMSSTQQEEYANLVNNVQPVELCFWGVLALFLQRRMIVHT
jgi:hypothetical protein